MPDWSDIRERMAVDMVRWSPKGTFTHGIGWVARRRVPRSLRNKLYGAFASRFGVDLGEVTAPLETYERFDDFFTRALPEGARPVAPGDDIAVSPCDGVLAEVGTTEGGRLIQAKGRDYTLQGLLADETEAARFQGGHFATIYLAPHNYHRVHAPTGGGFVGYRHVPGAFYPVKPSFVRHVAGLFSINERLVTYIEGPLGRVAVVMVAAMGVGHITVPYDDIETHRGGRDGSHQRARAYDAPRPVDKGGELGTFHLGSTVVLLFQPGRVTLAGLERGRAMRMGEPLGARMSGRTGEVAA